MVTISNIVFHKLSCICYRYHHPLFVSRLNESVLHLLSFLHQKSLTAWIKRARLLAWIKPLWCIFYPREPASPEKVPTTKTWKLKQYGSMQSVPPFSPLCTISACGIPLWSWRLFTCWLLNRDSQFLLEFYSLLCYSIFRNWKLLAISPILATG